MLYNLSFWSDIGFSIKQALRTLTGKIAALLYEFIVNLYDVFMYVARAEILEDEFIQRIYNKVGMILGIFMVFKLSFSLIQSLVDPNKLNDPKKGFVSIIRRSIIAIVLLGVTPSIFNAAFEFQSLIVGTENNTDNLIYKLVVGAAPSNSAASFGRIIASDLYFGFFKEKDGYKLNQGLAVEYPDSGGVKMSVHDYDYIKRSVEDGTMSFHDTVEYLSIVDSGQYVIDWNELFAIGMAIVMIWLLVTYCIQVATRVIQLAYLQLIAPVPILSYISDPEGTFTNWTKQCLTTYLDLFIRLAIIYFIITVCTQILEAFGNAESVLFASTGLNENSPQLFWVKLFLIIGLLMFGKKVPDLLKELFPNLGGGAASLSMGLKSPRKTLNDIPGMGLVRGAATFGAGAAIGGIAGVATGLRYGEGIRGKLAGAAGGFFRGASSARTNGNILTNARNGINNTRNANIRAYQRHHDGSTFFGRMVPTHEQRVHDEYDREINAYKDFLTANDKLIALADKDSNVKAAIAARDSLLKSGNATSTQIKAAEQKIKARRGLYIKNEIDKEKAKAGSGNVAVINALKEMETRRTNGIKNGFAGFSEMQSMDINSQASLDVARSVVGSNNTTANDKYSQRELASITQLGGDRNERYRQSGANSQYGNGGNH